MLKKLLSTREPPPAEIDGVRVVPNARAKRLSLRVDRARGDVVLTWPKRTSLTAATRFVLANRGWIDKHRATILPPQPFADGVVLSVAGQSYTVTHAAGRGLTRFDGDKIIVHGDAAHVSRRVRDFLKAEALRVLKELSDQKAATLDLKPSGVRVLDPKSRWGSCAPDGKLMYSWRIILAPVAVMDYLVAHEVAHRVHMNHGPKFWRLCTSLTADAKSSRRWLGDFGQTLMVWK